MIRTGSKRLNCSPAPSCVDGWQDTTQGLIYPMSALLCQHLFRCDEHIDAPSGGDALVSLNALRSSIDEQFVMVQQLQHRRRRIARAYARLRRQRAHPKAQRSLRRKLNRAYRREAEAMETRG